MKSQANPYAQEGDYSEVRNSRDASQLDDGSKRQDLLAKINSRRIGAGQAENIFSSLKEKDNTPRKVVHTVKQNKDMAGNKAAHLMNYEVDNVDELDEYAPNFPHSVRKTKLQPIPTSERMGGGLGGGLGNSKSIQSLGLG